MKSAKELHLIEFKKVFKERQGRNPKHEELLCWRIGFNTGYLLQTKQKV